MQRSRPFLSLVLLVAFLFGGFLLLVRVCSLVSEADAVDALKALFSDPDLTLKASTKRTYVAQAKALLGFQLRLGMLSLECASTGMADLRALIKARRGPNSQRTSAKKLKDPTFEDYRLLLEDYGRRIRSADLADRVLAFLLRVGTFVGLRPIEWLSASLNGDQLIVVNAKRTNGRGCGKNRPISLEDVPPAVVQ